MWLMLIDEFLVRALIIDVIIIFFTLPAQASQWAARAGFSSST
jgi:hypothetical protein